MLTDAHYAAIGRVAVAAAQLETRVCMLLVLIRGNTGDAHAMATKNNSSWRKEMRGLCEQLKNRDSQAICDWLDGVDAALEQRHALMHSEWMRDSNSEVLSPIGVHPKRDQVAGTVTLQLIPANERDWTVIAEGLNELHRLSNPFVHQAAVECGLYDG